MHKNGKVIDIQTWKGRTTCLHVYTVGTSDLVECNLQDNKGWLVITN